MAPPFSFIGRCHCFSVSLKGHLGLKKELPTFCVIIGSEEMTHSPRSILFFSHHRSSIRAEKFAKDHGVAKMYTKYEDLIYDPNVDVVYIATRADNHAELATWSLYNKKSTVVEKPLTLSVKDTKTLIHLARENEVFFMYVN